MSAGVTHTNPNVWSCSLLLLCKASLCWAYHLSAIWCWLIPRLAACACTSLSGSQNDYSVSVCVVLKIIMCVWDCGMFFSSFPSCACVCVRCWHADRHARCAILRAPITLLNRFVCSRVRACVCVLTIMRGRNINIHSYTQSPWSRGLQTFCPECAQEALQLAPPPPFKVLARSSNATRC